VRAGRKVLMEFDDNNAIIVDNPQGILDQELTQSIYQISILL